MSKRMQTAVIVPWLLASLALACGTSAGNSADAGPPPCANNGVLPSSMAVSKRPRDKCVILMGSGA